ncbi:MAG: hypothetical protein ACXVCY_08565 [Pseudobdellovibrionaceae bacterium]
MSFKKAMISAGFMLSILGGKHVQAAETGMQAVYCEKGTGSEEKVFPVSGYYMVDYLKGNASKLVAQLGGWNTTVKLRSDKEQYKIIGSVKYFNGYSIGREKMPEISVPVKLFDYLFQPMFLDLDKLYEVVGDKYKKKFSQIYVKDSPTSDTYSEQYDKYLKFYFSWKHSAQKLLPQSEIDKSILPANCHSKVYQVTATAGDYIQYDEKILQALMNQGDGLFQFYLMMTNQYLATAFYDVDYSSLNQALHSKLVTSNSPDDKHIAFTVLRNNTSLLPDTILHQAWHEDKMQQLGRSLDYYSKLAQQLEDGEIMSKYQWAEGGVMNQMSFLDSQVKLYGAKKACNDYKSFYDVEEKALYETEVYSLKPLEKLNAEFDADWNPKKNPVYPHEFKRISNMAYIFEYHLTKAQEAKELLSNNIPKLEAFIQKNCGLE